MTTEFRHMLDRFVLIYLDDIFVYSRSLDEHVEHLRTVLERLRQAKYKANRGKCEFAEQELEYLGHYVTPQGIRPLADKIKALPVWPEPTNTTNVRSFMGLAGCYQRFISGYSRIAAPMTRLQSPKVPFVFDDAARRSFQALKTTMLMAPVLSIYDPTLPTRVTTDASGYGIGAVLEQHDGDDWHPVEYFSHKVPPINSLDDARKELLAFVMALKRWGHFLLGRRRFTWVTDNNPLTYYKTQDTVSSTIGRWMYFIDQFDFTSKHLPDLSNRAADALSQRPDLCAMTHHAFAFDEELQRHFIRAYQSDPDFGTLYAQLSSDHPPASHYRIADGYLLLHSRGKDPRDRRLRTRLLGEYHDSRLAGHFGVNRTIARLRQRFRWPDLITDVTRYCDSCEVCRRSKPRNRNPYGELHPMPIPREPGLSIAMDVTGPFPRDRLGHDGILTVVDRLSKYARFLPCKCYSTAPEMAHLLHTGWICGHGVPEDIVSDRDTRFMSAFWTALMQESDTTMKPSSARHPQTDGQTERAHQTAQMMLCTFIRPDQNRLPDIEFAYNTSVHPAIGVTPFELHHGGRKGRIFADLLLPRPADIDAACSLASVRKYRDLLTQARANIQKAQVRMQQQANRRRVPCPIRAGDLVWVSAEEFALEQDVSRKLLPKWFGPWSMTAAAGDEPDGPSFVINIPEHLTVHPVFHASKLATYTPAKSDDFLGRRSQDPPCMDGHQEVDASSPIASTAASRGTDVFVTEMSKAFQTLYKLSRNDVVVPLKPREDSSAVTKAEPQNGGSFANPNWHGDGKADAEEKQRRGELKEMGSELVAVEEVDDRLVTVATSLVSVKGSTGGGFRDGGKGNAGDEEGNDAEAKPTSSWHIGNAGCEGSNVVESEVEFASFSVTPAKAKDRNGVVTLDDDVQAEVSSTTKKKGLVGRLARYPLKGWKGRKGHSASFDRAASFDCNLTEMVEVSANCKSGNSCDLRSVDFGIEDGSPIARRVGETAFRHSPGKENQSKQGGESPGAGRGGEEVERRMIVSEQTNVVMPLSYDLDSHLQSQQMVPMEFLERSLAVKERSIALKYELIRMKKTELMLKSQGGVRKEKANTLQEEQILLMRSKITARERETREKRKLDAVTALARSFADELVAGLCIMCVALLYCGWQYGRDALSQQIGACNNFLEAVLAVNKRQSSWWSRMGIGYLFGGVFVGFYKVLCQLAVACRILVGFLILSVSAWLVLRRNVIVTAHERPVTSLFLTLGVFCGYAGKVAVDSSGGSGWHWLMIWQVLCVIHICANCHIGRVYRLLNGRWPDEDEQARKTGDGRDELTLRAALSVPIWLRHLTLRVFLLGVLPLVASFLAFVPADRLTNEIGRAVGLQKASAALRTYVIDWSVDRSI
ncbi:hypothetical protein CBR_g49522 [Chara braunii]|uniref:Integrase catalytic domain-containing protein n=1 Tax=Chara braunii TaxID=69332 RepID=A0A388M5A9_CHABU|nr:hypothetical protein CBR_g49522 [Chara braunii]|eukprot:GBG89669.1 hypothetical protein CBR_g49522 [Chara braunii]